MVLVIVMFGCMVVYWLDCCLWFVWLALRGLSSLGELVDYLCSLDRSCVGGLLGVVMAVNSVVVSF